jgi:beta-lactamase regulating signal transducer with metallopeptidase domain
MTEILTFGGALGGWLARWIGPTIAWTALVFAAASLGDRFLARRVRASWLLLLYAAVPLRMALPSNWTSPFGLLAARAAGRAQVHATDFTAVAAGATTRAGWDGQTLLGLAYVLVALALAGWWLYGRGRLAGQIADARPARQTVAALDPHSTILEHDTLGPLVFGCWRPRIVLPTAVVDTIDPAALGCVLRHERAHIDRGDPWILGAIQLVSIAAWPIVPVWLAARRARQLLELAADERALGVAGADARRRYGETLLQMADFRPRTLRRLAPAELAFGSQLSARARALGWRRRWPVSAQMGLIVIFMAISVATAARRASPAQTITHAPSDLTSSDRRFELGQEAARLAMARVREQGGTARVSAVIHGSLDKEVIRAGIRRAMPKIKQCAEDAGSPDGKVVVQFTISATGSVVHASVAESTLASGPFFDCITGAIRELTFPKPAGGGIVIVKYPFWFRGDVK